MSDYYSDAQPPAPQNNPMAVTSIIAGLGGWLLVVIFICLTVVITFLGVITLGLGSLLGICLIPLQFIIPIAWIVGIITGHIGLKQIQDSGEVEGGRNMAITGLISGYVGLGILCLFLVVTILLVIAGASIPILEEILGELGWLISFTGCA